MPGACRDGSRGRRRPDRVLRRLRRRGAPRLRRGRRAARRRLLRRRGAARAAASCCSSWSGCWTSWCSSCWTTSTAPTWWRSPTWSTTSSSGSAPVVTHPGARREVHRPGPLQGALHERGPDLHRERATGQLTEAGDVLHRLGLAVDVVVDADGRGELGGEPVEPDRLVLGRRAGLARGRPTERQRALAGALGDDVRHRLGGVDGHVLVEGDLGLLLGLVVDRAVRAGHLLDQVRRRAHPLGRDRRVGVGHVDDVRVRRTEDVGEVVLQARGVGREPGGDGGLTGLVGAHLDVEPGEDGVDRVRGRGLQVDVAELLVGEVAHEALVARSELGEPLRAPAGERSCAC